MKNIYLKLSIVLLNIFLSLSVANASFKEQEEEKGNQLSFKPTEAEFLYFENNSFPLPPEVCGLIFQFFTFDKLKDLRFVSKEFNMRIDQNLLPKKVAIDLRPDGRLDEYLISSNSLYKDNHFKLTNIQFQMPFTLSAHQMERFNILFPINRNIKIFAIEDNSEFYIDGNFMQQLCYHDINFNEYYDIYKNLEAISFRTWSNILKSARHAYEVLESSEKYIEKYTDKIYYHLIGPNAFFKKGYEASLDRDFELSYKEPQPVLSTATNGFVKQQRWLTMDFLSLYEKTLPNLGKFKITFSIKPDLDKVKIVEEKTISFYADFISKIQREIVKFNLEPFMLKLSETEDNQSNEDQQKEAF